MPALGKQRHHYEFEGWSGQQNEFQDSKGYTQRNLSWKTNKQKVRSEKIMGKVANASNPSTPKTGYLSCTANMSCMSAKE